MSASHAPALRAIALQLLDELDRYELDVDRMLAPWPRGDAHLAVDAHMERMRDYCRALFGMSVAWAEVLIAQAELMQFLWWLPAGQEVKPDAVAPHRARVRIAADSLRNRVLWLLPAEHDLRNK